MKLAFGSDCFLCLFMWRGQPAGHKNSAAGLALGSLALILTRMIPASVVSRLLFWAIGQPSTCLLEVTETLDPEPGHLLWALAHCSSLFGLSVDCVRSYPPPPPQLVVEIHLLSSVRFIFFTCDLVTSVVMSPSKWSHRGHRRFRLPLCQGCCWCALLHVLASPASSQHSK